MREEIKEYLCGYGTALDCCPSPGVRTIFIVRADVGCVWVEGLFAQAPVVVCWDPESGLDVKKGREAHGMALPCSFDVAFFFVGRGGVCRVAHVFSCWMNRSLLE